MSADRFHPKHSALVVDRRPDGGLDFSVNSKHDIATEALTDEQSGELLAWLGCEVTDRMNALVAWHRWSHVDGDETPTCLGCGAPWSGSLDATAICPFYSQSKPDDIEQSAACDALDRIAALCGCAQWEYPGQVVRDVQTVVASRDQFIRQAPDKAERERVRRAESKAGIDLLSEELRSQTEAHRKTVTWLDAEVNRLTSERDELKTAHEAAEARAEKAEAIMEPLRFPKRWPFLDRLPTPYEWLERYIDGAVYDDEKINALAVEQLAALKPAAPTPAPWEAECEIIEDYMPPFPEPDTRPKVVVRHKPSDRFLRYSVGPRQGHFWDCYGEDYQDVELAQNALSLSPHPTERGWNESGPLARPGPEVREDRNLAPPGGRYAVDFTEQWEVRIGSTWLAAVSREDAVAQAWAHHDAGEPS